MHRTCIIRREYLHFVPKYSRYEKRHKNLAAHVSPCFRVEDGDIVTVGQCRPLSKTVRQRATISALFYPSGAGVRILTGATGSIQRAQDQLQGWRREEDQGLRQILVKC